MPVPVTPRGASPRRRAVAIAAAVLAALVAFTGCSGESPPSAGPSAPVTTAPPKPDADPGIEDLMASSGMTPRARRTFTKANPHIEDAPALARSCAEVIDVAPGSTGTHTYGCVVDGVIHVRSFARPEVRDLIYVSAAHELLHVVYAQLPRAERERLDAELTTARAATPALEERLEVYKDAGDDSADEVHSLLGTEFPGLSPNLEAHFAKYFDRALVLAAFQRTLGEREDEIRALQASVDDLERRLNTLKSTMDAQENAGNLRSYNANVPVYNDLVQEHNAAVQLSNQKVDEYNHITD